MSKELQVIAGFSFSKGGAKLNISESISVDITGDSFIQGVQEIGFAAEEVLVEADALGTPGYVFVKNLNATYNVNIGKVKISSDKDAMPIVLGPGKIAIFPTGYAIYAMAETAACLLAYAIVEA